MDWSYNGIWFEQISAEKKLTWDFKENKITDLYINDIEYFTTWHFKHKGAAFDALPASDKLLYLEFNWANFKDLSGIEKYPGLKRLELHYCTKLESDSGLSAIGNSLEWLHINQSKKLQIPNEISKLSKLKVLCLNSCGPLTDIRFITNLPNLIDFRFVDTNILDGDLTPIIEHPTLKSAGFLNKRHYNITHEKIELILESKFNEEYKEYAYKGKYKTFKYK